MGPPRGAGVGAGVRGQLMEQTRTHPRAHAAGYRHQQDPQHPCSPASSDAPRTARQPWSPGCPVLHVDIPPPPQKAWGACGKDEAGLPTRGGCAVTQRLVARAAGTQTARARRGEAVRQQTEGCAAARSVARGPPAPTSGCCNLRFGCSAGAAAAAPTGVYFGAGPPPCFTHTPLPSSGHGVE